MYTILLQHEGTDWLLRLPRRERPGYSWQKSTRERKRMAAETLEERERLQQKSTREREEWQLKLPR